MRALAPLKFIMVTEGRIASASILDRVFSELHRQGIWDYQAFYEWDSSFDEIGEAVKSADAVLFLRCSRPEEVTLLELAKRRGIPALYCTDDDFDALDPSTPQGEFMARPEIAASRDTFVRTADLVWVFTHEMSDRLRDRAQRIHIGRLPSFVEDHGWDLQAIDDYGQAEASLTIGYGGRYIHAPDLHVIVEPLHKILDSPGRPVRAEFIDCVPPALENHSKVRRMPYFDNIRQYYDYLRTARWAIGLAPLMDTVGNRAKTNNKYREYAALGVPGIYSDMPVYSSSVRHRETGFLAPHTEQGMYEAMLEMLSNADLRRSIKRNALCDAATTYALLPMQQEWLREVSLLASRRDSPVRLLVVGSDGATTVHVDALPASQALERQGRLQFDYVQPTEVRPTHVVGRDAVLLVRAFQPEVIPLLDWADRAKAALICAYDDDFLGIPRDFPANPGLGEYYHHSAVRAAVTRFLRECALIACSTPQLTQRSREYNSSVMEAIYGFDTTVLPIEPLAERTRGNAAIKVGFFGSNAGVAAPWVANALRCIKERFGERVCLEVISLGLPRHVEEIFDWKHTQVLSWEDSLQLLRSRAWDVGLAPLEDTDFNAAKQATKFRDYAWAGMAMVCSRVPVYQRPIIDGIHGLLVGNTEAEWEIAVARLIEDHDLRERLRRAARDLFAQAHTLDATICSWYQLLWRIARHREGRGLPLSDESQGRVISAVQSRLVAPASSSTGISACPPLTGGRLYEIFPGADGWEALDVMLGLHQRSAAGQLVLSIYADGAIDQPIRRIAGDLAEAADNCLFRFSFPPITNTRQRQIGRAHV